MFIVTNQVCKLHLITSDCSELFRGGSSRIEVLHNYTFSQSCFFNDFGVAVFSAKAVFNVQQRGILRRSNMGKSASQDLHHFHAAIPLYFDFHLFSSKMSKGSYCHLPFAIFRENSCVPTSQAYRTNSLYPEEKIEKEMKSIRVL